MEYRYEKIHNFRQIQTVTTDAPRTVMGDVMALKGALKKKVSHENTHDAFGHRHTGWKGSQFPVKLHETKMIFGFFTFPIICDERRRPKSAPRRVNNREHFFFKNTELPRRAPRGALWREALIPAIFIR